MDNGVDKSQSAAPTHAQARTVHQPKQQALKRGTHTRAGTFTHQGAQSLHPLYHPRTRGNLFRCG